MNTCKNIAILGGGIMGVMNAYRLTRAGHTITLHDPQGFPAHNASWIAGGMLAPYSEIEHMDETWANAGLDAIQFWRGLKLDTGFHQKGSLLIAHTEDRHILERFKTHLPPALQHTQAPQEIERDIPTNFTQSLYLQDEAHLEPQKTMQALTAQLKENGVKFTQEARSPEDTDADIVIDCRGMGASDKDLRGVKGEIALVRNGEFNLSRPVRIMHPRYPLYVVPRPNNVFMIGATVIESEEAGHTSLKSAMELMSALYTLSPSFGEAELIEFKAGIRPSYPDNLPRIKVDGNVISANGLFRHGYLLSPIMAEAIESHIGGEEHKYWNLFNGQKTHKNSNQRAA